MSLCEECQPECDHDYCDNCTKCHECGVLASAPAAPLLPNRSRPLPNQEWIIPRPTMVPGGFDERDYYRYTSNTTYQAQSQLH